MSAGRCQAKRAPYWLAVAALSGCAYGAGNAGTVGEAASCAGPVLTTAARAQSGAAQARAVSVTPGEKLRIYGYWYQTCHDTNHQPPSRPFRHLTIFIIQGHSREPVATVDARQPGGTFDVVARLPASLHPGTATVRTSLMNEVPLRLRVKGRN